MHRNTTQASRERLVPSTEVSPTLDPHLNHGRLLAALERFSPERVRELRAVLKELVGWNGMDSGAPPMFFEKAKTKQTPVLRAKPEAKQNNNRNE